MGRRFRQLGGECWFRPWKEWDVEEFVIGKFLGTREDQYGKTNVELEVEEVNFDLVNQNDNPLTKGKKLVLNSCGALDNKVDEFEKGMFVRVEYTGEITLTKGPYKGKKAHTVEVFIEEGEDSGEAMDSFNGEDDSDDL